MSALQVRDRRALSLYLARDLTPPWRWPAVAVARLLLASYARTAWLWAECFCAAAVFVVVKDFSVTADYWYALAAISLGAEAMLGTMVHVRRALGARAYLPLTRLRPCGAYLRGIALAAGVVRVPLCLLCYGLVLATGRTSDASPARVAMSLVALLAGQFALVAGTVAFTPPLATQIERTGLALWLILTLLWYSADGAPAHVLAIFDLPLVPFMQGYALVQADVLDAAGALALLADGALIVALITLACWWLNWRDFGNL